MNKAELVSVIAEKTGLSKKDSEKVLSAAVETISEALRAGDKVQLVGFGTFEVKERPARTGRDPRTGNSIDIAASRLPGFKPGKALKDAVAE